MSNRSEPVKVLFVCMGNICRSPAAEAVMRHLIGQKQLDGVIEIDSAGTIGYHAGNPSDARMREAGTRRGYLFEHRARQVRRQDFLEFDYIVAMDRDNMEDLERYKPSGHNGRAEVSLLLEHCIIDGTCEVPDPYYGGPEGFELVLDLVEKGCAALLESIVDRHELNGPSPSAFKRNKLDL